MIIEFDDVTREEVRLSDYVTSCKPINDMITHLVNQITVKRVIPAEQKLRKRKLLGTETNRSDSEDN